MEKNYNVFLGIGKKIPAICGCFDEKTQDTVNFDKKLQKNACNIRSIAIIYNKINLYMFLKEIQRRIQKMEGAVLC